MLRLYGSAELAEIMESWYEVDENVVPPKKREQFKARVKAVKMYAKGYTLKDIHEKTGIHTTRIAYYVNKCLETNSDGKFEGFDALIPYRRTKATRGRFVDLCESESDIMEKVDNKVFRKRTGTDKNMSIKLAFKLFTDLLKKSGRYDVDTYPFTLNDNGRRNFYRIMKKRMLSSAGRNRLSKDAYALEKATSGHNRLTGKPLIPFSVVEIDGHRIDSISCIDVPNLEGELIPVPIERLWLIAMIDVPTKAIIGYSISISRNYDHFDVLECMENAIKPFSSITGKTGGMPSDSIPQAAWAIFNEVRLDNAKAHLAKNVISQTSSLGCSFTFGPVGTPTMRPHIERCFGVLEENSFHRLPSTTGNNPRDVRRENAEKDAIKYRVTLDVLIEMIEDTISVYNNTPHDGAEGFTPLEAMAQRFARGLIPRHVPLSKREDFKVAITEKRTIRGNRNKGQRPYIQYECNRYSSPEMAEDYSLIGTTITLKIWPQDISCVDAYMPDGSFLGKLSIKNMPEGMVLPLKQMILINKFKRERALASEITETIVDQRIKELEEAAATSKKSATDYARAKKSIKKQNNAKPEKPKEDSLYSSEELEERLKFINKGDKS